MAYIFLMLGIEVNKNIVITLKNMKEISS